jgi:hypothetical protein
MNLPTSPVSKSETMEAGVQPLDGLMTELGLSNHDVVAAAGVNLLTHKVVAKARRGRKLTRRSQDKIVAALNAKAGRAFRREDCFSYFGR